MASFILPLLSGLTGLFAGGKQQTTNQSGQQSGQQTTSGGTSSSTSGSTNPILSQLQQRLANLFGSGAENQYNQDANLTGYTGAGLQGIQGQGNANRTAIQNNLASKGLSFSPAASTALTQNTINTGNQQQGFLQQIPLLQRQLHQQDLSGLEGAFGALPTGTSSTGSNIGTTNGTTSSSGSYSGSGSQSGNPLAGLFSGLGSGLAGPATGTGGLSNIQNLLRQLGFGGG